MFGWVTWPFWALVVWLWKRGGVLALVVAVASTSPVAQFGGRQKLIPTQPVIYPKAKGAVWL